MTRTARAKTRARAHREAILRGIVMAAAIAIAAVGKVSAQSSDPTVVGQWSAVQYWPIVAVHAHLLPSGDVLAWTDSTANGGAQIWRPATNSFTPASFSPVSLFCSGHVYLSDGRLLVVGGIVGLQDDLGPHETEFFDPTTELWTAGALMAEGRYYPTATTLPDGRVMVQGGTTTCGTCIAETPEIYDPVANVWTPMAASAQKVFHYFPHMYVLPDGRVLAAAQDDQAVITQALDLNTQTWTTIDSRLIDGHSSVMYRPGKILKAGKATADNPGNPSLATSYTLDMTQPSPTWQSSGSMAYPRSYLNLTALPDGQVLATGGSTVTDLANFSAAVYAAELWSPASRTWTTLSSAQIPRLYHSTALLLPDATVLVAGGGREAGRSVPDPKDEPNAEIFSPPYLFKGARPAISSAPSLIQYGTSFSVVTPDALQIGSVSLIALGSVTHAFNQNQRFVPLTFDQADGLLTVHPPVAGTIAPPGPYMLFLVNTAGVPSTAAMVRLSGSGTDTEPPTAPSGLQAAATGAAVNLTWQAATDNLGVTAYDVHRSTTSGFVPGIANHVGQTTGLSYVDSGMSSGTYYYAVRAQDAAGNASPPSNEASATVANSGLVAAWSFSEGTGTTATDLSGHGNNGTISGATWTTQGKFGSALSFNGTSSKVTVADAASLDLSTAMTLEAWVMPSAVMTGWKSVIDKNTDGYYLMASSSSGCKSGVGCSMAVGGTFSNGNQNLFGPAPPTAGPPVLPANTWHHVAATLLAGNLHLYLDGVEKATRAQAAPFTPTTGTLQIGADAYAGEYFKGVIDEVRIYNRALSVAEIQSDMNTPVSGGIVQSSVDKNASTGAIVVSWTDSASNGTYRVRRATGYTPADFAGATCWVVQATTFTDPAPPDDGFSYVYLVDAGSSCP
jgi:Concanavalin A-like lectin/glucanases superfamily/Domain of unknown function (DUF1929)